MLLDADKRTARELTDQVDRFVFAKAGGRGIAVLKDKVTRTTYHDC